MASLKSGQFKNISEGHTRLTKMYLISVRGTVSSIISCQPTSSSQNTIQQHVRFKTMKVFRLTRSYQN